MQSKEDSFAEDHFLVRAYSGTSAAIISELFSACRDAWMTRTMGEDDTDSIANLRDHITAYISNLTKEHIDTINRELADTFHKDKLLAVKIIEALIDVPYMDYTVKGSRFANFLAIALSTTLERQVDAVVQALHRLIKEGGSLSPEIVSAEAMRSFEWLSSPEDPEENIFHYAACRVLTMFASEVPEMIKQHFSQDAFMDSIWNAFSNKNASVREAARDTVNRFLDSKLILIDVVSKSLKEIETVLRSPQPFFKKNYWQLLQPLYVRTPINERNQEILTTPPILVDLRFSTA
eukprot:PhF_6_TR1987/c0_g2_i1/m.3330